MGRLTLIAWVLVAAPATAVPPSVLVEETTHYFAGEKEAARVFMGVGAMSLAAGTALAFQDDRVAYHSAWPMLGVGLVEALAVVILEATTDAQVGRLLDQIGTDPEGFRQAELTRMRRVDWEFTALLWLEGVLAAGGIAMAIAGEMEDIEPLAGVGYSLTAQSAVMFCFDMILFDHAKAYTAGIGGQF